MPSELDYIKGCPMCGKKHNAYSVVSVTRMTETCLTKYHRLSEPRREAIKKRSEG